MSRMHNIYGGGSKTNVNGLEFERDTSLDEALENEGYHIVDGDVYDKDSNLIGISIPKNNLYKNFGYIEYGNKTYKELTTKEEFESVKIGF